MNKNSPTVGLRTPLTTNSGIRRPFPLGSLPLLLHHGLELLLHHLTLETLGDAFRLGVRALLRHLLRVQGAALLKITQD